MDKLLDFCGYYGRFNKSALDFLCCRFRRINKFRELFSVRFYACTDSLETFPSPVSTIKQLCC